MVDDGVNVGLVGMDVGVIVDVDVSVGEDGPVGLGVTVNGWGVDVAVEVESGVDVERGVSVSGWKIKNSRMMTPMSAGTAYRVQIGKDFTFWYGVTTGGFPVYPSARRRSLKLSSYSPTEKFE